MQWVNFITIFHCCCCPAHNFWIPNVCLKCFFRLPVWRITRVSPKENAGRHLKLAEKQLLGQIINGSQIVLRIFCIDLILSTVYYSYPVLCWMTFMHSSNSKLGVKGALLVLICALNSSHCFNFLFLHRWQWLPWILL